MGTPVWADGCDRLDLPPLPASTSSDAVVVGLGASGLAAVDAFLERGLDVVGLDATVVGGGAAGRNGGLLLGGLALFHHDAVVALGLERATAAYRATLDELDRAAARHPAIVRRTGSLRIASSTAEMQDCEEHLRALHASAIGAEPYDGPQGTGILVVDDAVIDPLARCVDDARRARAAGARLHQHSPVASFATGRAATASGLVVEADHVVICVDGGLESLVPELAGRVRSTRLQMASTAPASDVTMHHPVYRRFGYDWWQQLPDGRLAVGGGRDLPVEEEWGAPPEPSEPVQSHLDHLLREVIGTTAEVERRWAGSVAYTDSRLPVVEILHDGVAVAGAYSGHGNLVGPLCARAAVELLLSGHSPLADLFAGPTLTP